MLQLLLLLLLLIQNVLILTLQGSAWVAELGSSQSGELEESTAKIALGFYSAMGLALFLLLVLLAYTFWFPAPAQEKKD